MSKLKFRAVGLMLLINSIVYFILTMIFMYQFFSMFSYIYRGTSLFILLMSLSLLYIHVAGGVRFLEFSKMDDLEIEKNKNRVLGWTVATFYANFIIGIFAFLACFSIEKN